MKQNSLISKETEILNVISIFYPDKEFLSLLFTSSSNELFEKSLTKWFNSNNDNYDPLNPYNSFYGITQAKPENLHATFALDKENTDALFSFLKSELINGKKQLKESINDAFELYTIDKISFIDDKETNTHMQLPINFYSFAISLKAIMQYYESQISSFSIGIFENLFSFNELNEEIFYYDLYCSYLLFIYFYEKSMDYNKALLILVLNNSSLYEGFTYHIIETIKAKEQLASSMRFDAIQMISLICKTSLNQVVIQINSSKIKEATITQLKQLLLQNDQLNISFLTIHAPSNVIQSFDISSLNKHSISLHLTTKGEVKLLTSSIATSTKERNISPMNKVRLFSIEGNDVAFKAIPSYFSQLFQFSYIATSINLDITTLKLINYLHSLTLKALNCDQFNRLIELNNFASLNDLELEIIDDNESILLSVDSLVNKSNLERLRIARILLKNNNIMITSENGFYFIDIVKEKIPKCTMFTLTNHTQFEIGDKNKDRQCKDYSLSSLEYCQVYKTEFDMITYYNTFSLSENELKCYSKQKKKILFHMTDYYALMLCVKRKYTKLKKIPILVFLGRFLCKPVGQLILVGNFID